ncbi:MAG: N-acetylneuraminate synthase family protein [Magnetococcales bacterium]|nr:N-acetylneuraminate synthase family protein [Magnetococcales bacterium]
MSFQDFFDTDRGVLIIAEIGTNHNGDFELAKELLLQAIDSGVDAVKFQAYRTENFFTKEVPAFPRAQKLGYTRQYDRFVDLELSPDQFISLAELTKKNGAIFMATPFDEESLAMLNPLLPAYKIASGDLINHQLLQQVSQYKKPCILSTGQGTDAEIAAGAAMFPPQDLALLHCVSSYPTPDNQVNLRSITHLQKCYPNIPIGYSDHSIGILGCVGAVAVGARIIEKHFTLDKNQLFGDHALSAEPSDMKSLVAQIRRMENMLGKEETICQEAEQESKKQLRRNLHLKRAVNKGEVLNNDMILPVVSLQGIPADRLKDVLNRPVLRDFQKGEALVMEDLG